MPGAAGATERRDPVDEGARVDLRAGSLTQYGDELLWTVRLHSRLSARTLSAGEHVCLLLSYGKLPTPHARVCLYARDDVRFGLGYQTLTPGTPNRPRPLRAIVRGAGTRTVKAIFKIHDARLDNRRFRWQDLALDVANPACADPVAPGCQDLLPEAAASARTTAPRLVGCVGHGPAQVSRMPRGRRAVALTFDDGPSSYTAGVLRILRAERVPATFFEIGGQVAGRAKLVRRILREGHALGNHTYSHANMAGGGNPGQISRTQAAIRRATGYTPCVFRPPYGATSGALVSEVHRMHLTSVLWSADPTDWSTPGTDAIRTRVLGQTHRGGIVLMHDGGGPRSQTVAALRSIIRTFKARHYRFMTVPDALGFRPVYAGELEHPKA
ncbi:MAG TPA: polysaccharide deacetylase family protein [Baekduia sp.]|nr:polysaccharide deacetylase family protein [Baekduia sp.]